MCHAKPEFSSQPYAALLQVMMMKIIISKIPEVKIDFSFKIVASLFGILEIPLKLMKDCQQHFKPPISTTQIFFQAKPVWSDSIGFTWNTWPYHRDWSSYSCQVCDTCVTRASWHVSIVTITVCCTRYFYMQHNWQYHGTHNS